MVHLVVVSEDLDLDLRNEVHLVLRAPIHLRVAPLPAESLDVRGGEPVHADRAQGLLHLVQAVRLDDCRDELHSEPPGISAASPTWVTAASRMISEIGR